MPSEVRQLNRMTVVGYRKEAAARSESGNAKHLKRLEQDVSVGPADIGSRRTALAAENSASDGQDGHALRRRRCSYTGLGEFFRLGISRARMNDQWAPR